MVFLKKICVLIGIVSVILVTKLCFDYSTHILKAKLGSYDYGYTDFKTFEKIYLKEKESNSLYKTTDFIKPSNNYFDEFLYLDGEKVKELIIISRIDKPKDIEEKENKEEKEWIESVISPKIIFFNEQTIKLTKDTIFIDIEGKKGKIIMNDVFEYFKYRWFYYSEKESFLKKEKEKDLENLINWSE